MSRNEITVANSPLPAKLAETKIVTAADRIRAWLERLAPTSRASYGQDLITFAAHLGCEGNISLAFDIMCNLSALGKVNEQGKALSDTVVALHIMEAWRDAMVLDGVASATINRRLSAVNSALREIKKADMGPGRVPIDMVTHEARRDTRGPDLGSVAAVVRALAVQSDPQSVRDLAIVLLGAQRGLRRAEIAGLAIQDVDLDAGRLRIKRKGKRELVEVEIEGAICEALARWMRVREGFAGTALFIGLGNRSKGKPISGHTVYEIIRRSGSLIGDDSWHPHKLRHTAITTVLERTGGSLATAQEFAGHAGVATTTRYIDDKKRLESEGVRAMSRAYTLPEKS